MIRWLPCLLLTAYYVEPGLAASPEWGGTVTLANDHMLRGTSRSSHEAALSAEAHVQTQGGWFAASWASTSRVRRQDPTTVDVAATVGYGAALSGDWSLRGSFTHYESPWQNRSRFYRYDEFTLDLRFREMLLLSVSYSPNTSRFGSSYGPVWRRDALAYEATFQQDLRHGFTAYTGIGYYDLSDLFGGGYWYGSTGMAFSHGPWRLEAAWVVPENEARRYSYLYAAGQRGLFSLSYSF